MTTEHMKTSIGRMSVRGILPCGITPSYQFAAPRPRRQRRPTLPVVWYSPSWCLSSSSETAPGASILFPRIRKGTVERLSMETARARREAPGITARQRRWSRVEYSWRSNARSESSSALDSPNRSVSAESTRKTIPSTSGK